MNHAPNLVTLSEPLSPVSEAYRALRMNVQFAAQERPLRTLLVVAPSAEGARGTPITLANLAVTMAQIEQEVILVDSDLRHPSLHTIFGVPNDVGLTTWMAGEDLDHPPLGETGVEGLRLLPSGPLPLRAPDLLGSKRMEQALQALPADMVLLAAPPVLAVTDAAVLASKVDGVLLVIAAGDTKRERAQAAVQQLQRVHARVLGAVLTGAS